MAETFDLTAPITSPALSRYEIQALHITWIPDARLQIILRGNDAKSALSVIYTGTTATTLLTNLNTANLSNRSLRQRILDRLVTDGHLNSGAVT